MAAMAVWKEKWKRHTLVAIVNAVPYICIYAYFINVFHVPFGDNTQPYKMPFGPQPFNSINWYSAVNTFVAEM